MLPCLGDGKFDDDVVLGADTRKLKVWRLVGNQEIDIGDMTNAYRR